MVFHEWRIINSSKTEYFMIMSYSDKFGGVCMRLSNTLPLAEHWIYIYDETPVGNSWFFSASPAETLPQSGSLPTLYV
jgi:hypothetical protein